MGRKPLPLGDPETVRQSIVDRAEGLFRASGYAKTTVAEIAKGLGMSQSNVYRYFPFKSALVEAICERIVLRIEERCRTEASRCRNARQALRVLYLEYFRAVKDNVIQGQRLHDMVVAAVGESWPVLQAHIERVDFMVRDILARGVAQGEFQAMDVAEVSLALQNAFSAFVYPALVERQLADAENSGGVERIEANLLLLADMLVEGIGRRPEPD